RFAAVPRRTCWSLRLGRLGHAGRARTRPPVRTRPDDTREQPVAEGPYDVVVVGAGPNGLAAAITMAARGLSVRLYEARDTVGGGCRTAELTLPGFRHDVCSAAHPLAAAARFMKALDLPSRGVQLRHADLPYAHPLDGGAAGLVHRSVDETAE